jgi:diguanylate cyclase (GGDEF)-like protein/PAS domain S-box-containing protein
MLFKRTSTVKAEVGLSMLPCGIVVLDAKNVILDVNTAFCSWFGYQKHEVLQQPLSMFFTPASKLLYLGHILPTLQSSGQVEEKYLLLKTAANTELPVLVNAHKTEFGNEPVFVIAMMKMLRRHAIEEQLITERRQAEQATAEKDMLNQQLKNTQIELIAKQQELMQLNENLEAISVSDALTGLYNRRVYDKVLDLCLSKFADTAESFALIVIDIDFFKLINDQHGHEVGDSVLQAVALQLKLSLREGDTLARIGGEEFAILLPTATLAEAKNVAERNRKSIEALATIPFKVTASFGVAQVQPNDTESTIYKRADSALYQSKSKGRNCVSG